MNRESLSTSHAKFFTPVPTDGKGQLHFEPQSHTDVHVKDADISIEVGTLTQVIVTRDESPEGREESPNNFPRSPSSSEESSFEKPDPVQPQYQDTYMKEEEKIEEALTFITGGVEVLNPKLATGKGR